MQINKIYKTISGEVGTVIPQGSPCLIIRTQGCNIHCHYCDSKETQPIEGGMDIGIKQLVSIAKSYGLPVLLTGGEPLIQKDMSSLILELMISGITVQVETNGTIEIDRSIPHDVGFILDYKSKEQFVNSFRNLSYNDWVKFPVKNEEQFVHACSVIKNNRNSKNNWAISVINEELGKCWVVNELINNKIPAILNVQIHKIIDLP